MNRPVRLNLPPADLRFRPDADSRRGGLEVYDRWRDKWVALTPEEWVRQHFVHYLTDILHYPVHLIGNEVSVRFNGMARRCDSVVYDTRLRPVAVVEYKAPSVRLTPEVFGQILRYNSVLMAPCIMVSNGMRHFACLRKPDGTYSYAESIPSFESLICALG